MSADPIDDVWACEVTAGGLVAIPPCEPDPFELVPFYEGDSQSIFFSGQKSANSDFKEGRSFATDLGFLSADFRFGYQHEWKRLKTIRDGES